MPIYTPFQSREPISVGNAGPAARSRSASAFVTPGQAALPEGLNQFAQGLNKLNNVVFSAEIQRREEALELSLLQRMQQFQNDRAQEDDDWRQNNQGENALNAPEEAEKRYQPAFDALMSEFDGIPRAQRYIQQHGGAIVMSGVARMRAYRDQQQEVYKDKLAANRKQIFLNLLADRDATPEQIRAGSRIYLSGEENYLRSKGLPPETARLEAEQSYRAALDERAVQGVRRLTMDKDFAGARAELKALAEGHPGDFSALFESGGVGSLAIGYDQHGGTSYGKFQISSKAGNMEAFISWLEKNGQEKAAEALKKAGPADTGSRSGKMPEAWTDLVRSGAITEDMQESFIRETHVEPLLASLKPEDSKALAEDPGLFRAAFSTAVQHGPTAAKRLLETALEQGKGDREAVLDALYEARKGQFGSSTPEIQEAAARRMVRERSMVGALGPDVILKLRGNIDKAEEESAKAARAQLTQEAYGAAVSGLKDLPYGQWDEAVLKSIDGSPVREEVKKLWDQQKAFQKDLFAAQDARIISGLFAEYSQLAPAQARQAVNARRAELLGMGLSIEGFKTLEDRLKHFDLETPENIKNFNILFRDMTEGAFDKESAAGLRAKAYAAGLTEDQSKRLVEFKEGGGMAGWLGKNGKIVREALDFYADGASQRKKVEESDYLKALLQLLPAERTPTPEDVYKAVANLYKDSSLLEAAKERTTGKDKLGGKFMAWRPDADSDEGREVREALRKELKREPTEDEATLRLREVMGIRGGVARKDLPFDDVFAPDDSGWQGQHRP
ncbi:MAG: hypothetical protein LBJ82_06845 [Deltaproteobacteria bacterium]|jgi:hypothetical protein|nr:hypothetical protein [Deltaproteobacteria bacterium]